jgi:diguanylate cyclase (GGDEF)-like protein
MIQEIYLIDNDNELEKTLKNILKEEENYKVKRVTSKDIDIVLKNIPSLVIINEGNENSEEDSVDICKKIKADEDNSITPIIVIAQKKQHEHKLELLKLGISDYIVSPIDEEFLYYTIINILKLMYLNRRISPLTGLPGNVQIQAEMKKRLANKENFSMMYLDLDNFKAYNDVYGFFNGDEIIKFTARVILKNVHTSEYEDTFVGHIGGDDFVAITSAMDTEEICQNIITEFDENVKRYYTEDDAQKGFLEVANRKGIIEQFPITAISIAVVEVDSKRFTNVLEIGEAGAGVKHLAKTILGSTYVIDRRKK